MALKSRIVPSRKLTLVPKLFVLGTQFFVHPTLATLNLRDASAVKPNEQFDTGEAGGRRHHTLIDRFTASARVLAEPVVTHILTGMDECSRHHRNLRHSVSLN
jgi:hypothetical protein